MFDTPIVGGVKCARERAITFLVGGSAALFERVKPVLEWEAVDVDREFEPDFVDLTRTTTSPAD